MTTGVDLRKDRTGDCPGTRLCARCLLSLLLVDFPRDRARFDGLATWCKECKNASTRVWAKTHPGQVREKARRRYATNPEPMRERNRRAGRERRRLLLIHYGGRCACCQEDRLEFLAIDHIDGGGTRHRAEVGKGDAFYKWLRRNGYPEGFRVLCHNCNLAIGFYGHCPHERAEGAIK